MSRRLLHFRKHFSVGTKNDVREAILSSKSEAKDKNEVVITRRIKDSKVNRIAERIGK